MVSVNAEIILVWVSVAVIWILARHIGYRKGYREGYEDGKINHKPWRGTDDAQ